MENNRKPILTVDVYPDFDEDGKLIDDYPVYAEKSVEKISFKWYAEKVFHDFFH